MGLEKVKGELKRLISGETGSVFLFWITFIILGFTGSERLQVSLFYPLCILTIILLQGSAYWWILYRRVTTSDKNYAKKAGIVYYYFQIMDAVLLCLCVPLVIWRAGSDTFDMLCGILLLFFAMIEWVNYFVVRLSYSLNPMILINRIAKRKLQKSKLAIEIANRNN